MGAARAQGAQLVIGAVEGVRKEGVGEGLERVTGVVIGGEVRDCDAGSRPSHPSLPTPALPPSVVICMGPWSSLAQDWLGLEVPITGIKSTSIVYRTPEPVEPFALFCGEDDRFGTHLEV
jgi:hypothetical protein